MASTESEGANVLTKYISRLITDLEQVLHCVGKRNTLNEVIPKYVIVYDCKVIRQVNEHDQKE